MGYVVGALFSDEAATKNSLIIPAVLVGGRKKKHTEGRNVYMGVRVVIPNMSKTFGALHYAGEGEAVRILFFFRHGLCGLHGFSV